MNDPATAGGRFAPIMAASALPERRATEEALKAGRASGGRCDGVARAGHRHGGGRPGVPGRVAGKRCARASASGPGRPRGPRREQGADDRQDAGRSAGIRRALPRDASGRDRAAAGSARTASTCWRSKSIACVAMDRWDVPALFDLVRSAYPFHDLSAESFESVLRLISGPIPDAGAARPAGAGGLGPDSQPALRRCRARPSLRWWGAGRFPTPASIRSTSGQGGRGWASSTRSSFTSGGWVKRSRLGNAAGGSRQIEPHRVVVSRAAGQTAVMPFWRGESAARSAELGEAVGVLCREVAERLDDPQSLGLARSRMPAGAARRPRASRLLAVRSGWPAPCRTTGRS